MTIFEPLWFQLLVHNKLNVVCCRGYYLGSEYINKSFSVIFVILEAYKWRKVAGLIRDVATIPPKCSIEDEE